MAGTDGSDADTWDPDASSSDTWAPSDPERTPETSSEPSSERYDVGPVVGRGGLADVRSALDRRLGREVAVKRLRRPRGGARARFLREARVAAQLEHPGIVPVHDVGVDDDGTPFYTMRYVRGEPMDRALARATTLEARLALLPPFLSVCQAMAYAHERGVVHRDLKPQNVMLGPFGESVVVDWGLARRTDDPDELPLEPTDDPSEEVDAPMLTRVGVVIGTPAYMAPEQARGEPVGRATDVYALGAMLYELLTGRTPRDGTGTAEQQLEHARRGDHPSVASVAPEAPRDLAAIAERALAPVPSQRYASAGGMSADLERWTQGRFVRAHRYTAVERLQNFYRRYRLAVWLGAAGVAATLVATTVGWVRTLAERDRAVQSEALAVEAADEARRASAALLVDRAARAFDDGDLLATRAFAVASLGMGESVEARGLLLGSWGAPSFPSLRSWPLPHPCVQLASDGSDLYCLGAAALTRLRGDGTVAWTVSVEPAGAAQLPGLAVSSGRGEVWVTMGSSATAYDVERGERLETYLGAASRGVVTHGTDVWWLGTDRLFHRSSAGLQERTLGPPFVSSLFLPPGGDAPSMVRAIGRVERADGEVQWVIGQVTYSVLPLADGTMWSLGPKSRVRHPDGREDAVVHPASAFVGSTDGRSAYVATSDGTLSVFDAHQPSVLRGRLPGAGPRGLVPFALSDDGTTLSRAVGGRLLRWSTALDGPSPRVDADAWSGTSLDANGEQRLLCGPDGAYAMDDGRTITRGQVEVRGPASMCRLVGGAAYITWGKGYVLEDGIPRRLDLVDQPHHVVGHQERVLMASGGLYRYDGQVLGRRVAHQDGPRIGLLWDDAVVTWSWDGARYVLSSRRPVSPSTLQVLRDGTVVEADGADAVWTTPNGERMRLTGHHRRVTRLLEVSGGRLITGGLDGRVLLWRRADGKLLADLDLHSGRIGELHHLPDIGMVEVSTFDGRTHLLWLDGWDAPASELAERSRRDGVEVIEGRLRLADGSSG